MKPHPFKFTVFPTLAADSMQVFEVASFAHLCMQLIAKPNTHAGKTDMPLLCPLIFSGERSGKGALRSNDTVIEVRGVCGDHDAGSMTLDDAAARLAAAKVECFLYTTASHTPGAPRWRVLAPFDEPTKDLAAHLAAVERLNHVLDGALKPESFTLSQSFYFGRVKGVEYLTHYVKGRGIDTLTKLARRPKSASVIDLEARRIAAALPAVGGSIEWPGFKEELRLHLRHVPSGTGRERWLAIGMGIHHACGGSMEGFEIWHGWSAGANDASYKGYSDCLYQWRSFKTTHKRPTTWGTVRKYLDEFTPVLPPPLPEDAEGLPYADIMAEPQVRAPIIEGWLYERTVLLQAADGGTGKSYMGLLEAMMVALGRDCGMGWKVEPGRALFYSGEDDADVIRIRMRLYCAHYGWRMEDLREGLIVVDRSETDCVLYSEGRGGTGEFTGEYARLVKTVQRVDPRYVVIDNASHVFNGNENNRATVRHFLSGLTALRRAVNLLAHVNKVTAGATSANQAVAYSGSTAWNNTVRARRAQSVEEGRGTITIAKSNYGPTGTTLNYDWDDHAKLFLPRSVVGRAHARDHEGALLDIVQQLEGRLASLDVRAPNHLAKLIQAHPSCPKGIDLKALKRWLDRQLTLGSIEEQVLMKPNRRPGKTYAVRRSRAP